VFFFFRFLRNSTHPALRWGIAALLGALGIALIVWGLVDHNTIIAIRGVVELLIVGYLLVRVYRPRRTPGGGSTGRLM